MFGVWKEWLQTGTRCLIYQYKMKGRRCQESSRKGGTLSALAIETGKR
jgi:hypothetical protein